MWFTKQVNITNKYDLLNHCEIRYDCVNIIEKLDEYNIIENILNYFDELQYTCDDIYDFFIFEIDDFKQLVLLLHSDGFLSDEKLKEILDNEEGEK